MTNMKIVQATQLVVKTVTQILQRIHPKITPRILQRTHPRIILRILQRIHLRTALKILLETNFLGVDNYKVIII